MKKWISFPKVEGITSRQAHTDLPQGTFEREMGKEGFYGPASHLYHAHPPTAWSNFEGPLKPRAYDTNKFGHDSSSPLKAKILLHNNSVRIGFWAATENMDHLVRNADGDEVLFVHQGAGDLYCDFGRLPYQDGDYIVIPRGVMWRLEPHQKSSFLLIEATGDSYGLPEKGLVGPHAIFDPAILGTPIIDKKFLAQQHNKTTTLRVKRSNAVSTITYPFNPLDATGWKGDLTAVKLNWRDIRPLMSHRYHLPPSAHTTFIATRFVICTFVPRPLESDPEALRVPFFHNNDDYDEFLFYHRGTFFSRDNIHPGMVTWHPSGFTHGPHPKAFSLGQTHTKKETDEVAVMVDARDSLQEGQDASSVEWKDYVWSWQERKK